MFPQRVGTTRPSLMAEGLFKTFVRLRHFGELSQIGTNMPIKPNIVIHTRRGIFVLTDQRLEAGGERDLVVRKVRAFERAARPCLGRGLVEIIPSFVAAA